MKNIFFLIELEESLLWRRSIFLQLSDQMNKIFHWKWKLGAVLLHISMIFCEVAKTFLLRTLRIPTYFLRTSSEFYAHLTSFTKKFIVYADYALNRNSPWHCCNVTGIWETKFPTSHYSLNKLKFLKKMHRNRVLLLSSITVVEIVFLIRCFSQK